jgi:hypothetical protein
MRDRVRVLPVTGWMLLRLGALAVGLGVGLLVLIGVWVPGVDGFVVLLLAAVAWFVGRVGQWIDDGIRRRYSPRGIPRR